MEVQERVFKKDNKKVSLMILAISSGNKKWNLNENTWKKEWNHMLCILRKAQIHCTFRILTYAYI